jgi:wyosine [tRNA(Phe)-imidazoG37] synthetase (radical SAM superfamily)
MSAMKSRKSGVAAWRHIAASAINDDGENNVAKNRNISAAAKSQLKTMAAEGASSWRRSYRRMPSKASVEAGMIAYRKKAAAKIWRDEESKRMIR